MIQSSFNFDIGTAGDADAIDWLFENFLEKALAAQKKGQDQAALRNLVRAEKLLGLGNKVGIFVKYSIQAGDRKKSISTAEAWTAYELQMNDLKQPKLSRGEFEKALPRAMRDIHGISRSNGVFRSGKACRGYMGCMLRGDAKPPTPQRERRTS